MPPGTLRGLQELQKIVKKAKSKRAATILYNRIIKSDDYYEVGMKVVKEGKLNESKMVTLPNGVKVKIEFKGITLQAKGKKPVFLDRNEMMTFFKATQKYMKQGLNASKLKEDFKNNEWEVYVADENRREKIVKVAKSKRAAVILYNKLIKTDKYHEVGMRVIKEGKLTEAKTSQS